jgi:hypothetical protein
MSRQLAVRLAGAGLSVGAILTAKDAAEAHTASARAHVAAWELVAAGQVSIPPLEGAPKGLEGSWAPGQLAARRDYCAEVRSHVQAAWAAVAPAVSFGNPDTWPDPLRIQTKERISFTVTDPVSDSD